MTGTPESRRRRADLLSLIFGVLFLGIAAAWTANYYLDLDWGFDWQLPNLGWLVAGALVLVGLLGIAVSLSRERTERAETDRTAATPPASEPGPSAGPATGSPVEGDRPQ